jgi:excisionase family DNA binding protein
MLRSSELAEHLGLTKNKIIQLANNGEIPAIRLPSGHYRFDADAVVEALRTGGSKNDD